MEAYLLIREVVIIDSITDVPHLPSLPSSTQPLWSSSEQEKPSISILCGITRHPFSIRWGKKSEENCVLPTDA